jgi:16S rRNA (guanine527-N7)-methyltransferase
LVGDEVFHVEQVIRAASYAGLTLDERQKHQLESYREWLTVEALPAGGIGPGEVDRLESRHLGDSLLYARFFPHESSAVWDLGTGVGLPGIPLAIALPDTVFHLVDRSQRRLDLVRRLIRILDLENCQVRQGEIDDLEEEVEVLVTRATHPPGEMAVVARRLLRPGGLAVMGGSWRDRPDSDDWIVEEIPPVALDHTIWLLIMRAA